MNCLKKKIGDMIAKGRADFLQNCIVKAYRRLQRFDDLSLLNKEEIFKEALSDATIRNLIFRKPYEKRKM